MKQHTPSLAAVYIMNRYRYPTRRIRPMPGQIWKQTFANKDSYCLAYEHLDAWDAYYIDKTGAVDTRATCKIATILLLSYYQRLS